MRIVCTHLGHAVLFAVWNGKCVRHLQRFVYAFVKGYVDTSVSLKEQCLIVCEHMFFKQTKYVDMANRSSKIYKTKWHMLISVL